MVGMRPRRDDNAHNTIPQRSPEIDPGSNLALDRASWPDPADIIPKNLASGVYPTGYDEMQVQKLAGGIAITLGAAVALVHGTSAAVDNYWWGNKTNEIEAELELTLDKIAREGVEGFPEHTDRPVLIIDGEPVSFDTSTTAGLFDYVSTSLMIKAEEAGVADKIDWTELPNGNDTPTDAAFTDGILQAGTEIARDIIVHREEATPSAVDPLAMAIGAMLILVGHYKFLKPASDWIKDRREQLKRTLAALDKSPYLAGLEIDAKSLLPKVWQNEYNTTNIPPLLSDPDGTKTNRLAKEIQEELRLAEQVHSDSPAVERVITTREQLNRAQIEQAQARAQQEIDRDAAAEELRLRNEQTKQAAEEVERQAEQAGIAAAEERLSMHRARRRGYPQNGWHLDAA
jgi:hypothetical protein